ncbi:MAG: hypothetical protein Q7S87_11690 [Agitococcus sp.]|nr:hypothetical protein [Agitococcus sp.]
MNQLETTKTIIYAHKRVSISIIQRKLHLRYPIVVELLEQLEKNALLKTKQGERQINWQHPDWQKIAQQPEIWEQWLEPLIADELYQYSLKQNNEDWWYIMREIAFSQQFVTFVDNEEEGLRWLSEREKVGKSCPT